MDLQMKRVMFRPNFLNHPSTVHKHILCWVDGVSSLKIFLNITKCYGHDVFDVRNPLPQATIDEMHHA